MKNRKRNILILILLLLVVGVILGCVTKRLEEKKIAKIETNDSYPLLPDKSTKDFVKENKSQETKSVMFGHLTSRDDLKKEVTKNNITYELNSSKYLFENYKFIVNEETPIKDSDGWIEAQSSTKLTVSKNNNDQKKLDFIGKLIDIAIDNKNILYIYTEDVWEKGSELTQYNLDKEEITDVQSIESVYPSQNYWIIYLNKKSKLISFNSGEQIVFDDKVNFVYSNKDKILVTIGKKIICYDSKLSKLWENSFETQIIEKLIRADKDEKNLVLYDETNHIRLFNLNSGNIIRTEILDEGFYVLDAIYISGFDALVVLQKNNFSNNRILKIKSNIYEKKIVLEDKYNKLFYLKDSKTLMIKDTSDETKIFNYNLNSFD